MVHHLQGPALGLRSVDARSGLLAERYRQNRSSKFQFLQTATFLSLVGDHRRPRVCDIGCGKGYWDYCLLRHGVVTEEVHGCDVFPDYQVEELAQVQPNVSIAYRAIDETTLPYERDSFDLAFSMDVIEHVAADAELVREHIRITRPGGMILIGTPNYWRIANIPLRMRGRLTYPRSMGTDTYGDVTHLREYTKGDLLRLVEANSASIAPGSVKIVPCWLGVGLTRLGMSAFPPPFEQLCQFWFVVFHKTEKVAPDGSCRSVGC